ncbi:hypothetical protein ABCS02_21325 [Microbacterium sp. X-17]|uniref:hypothetical protein n=1 Tax=Microbacterium sp. X-17 TaxID=3144404 RepID=UPI0031F59CBE
MAKTSSSAQPALDAIAVAADAATLAHTVARSLPRKDAKKVTALADEVRALTDVDTKTVRKNPEKYTKQAVAITGALVRATAKAIAKAERTRVEVAPPLAAVPGVSAPIVLTAPALAELTVIELRSRARAAGHHGYTRMRKAQLVALLS